ncbi:hypothetical protein ACVR25_000879 [Cronobacter sakazakii]|nr:hypothetical protein [Cronobacter sakazakii]ELY4362536.1 hypothetical protein [Cronobacter sakazakii]ELY4787275.1 hypothetical protein [Cronobacter sakazakii]ELY6235989.1 hypothetical protein [Cronobacter sakazakii]
MKIESPSAFEHAWKYFELHSQQRMVVFNFYIAIIGLLGAGSGVCLQQGGKYLYFASGLGAFIIFITFIFHKLDVRVSFLIKNSEKALKYYEDSFTNQDFKIFTKDNEHIGTKFNIFGMWSYGKCFRASFYIIANIGLLLFISPVLIRW